MYINDPNEAQIYVRSNTIVWLVPSLIWTHTRRDGKESLLAILNRGEEIVSACFKRSQNFIKNLRYGMGETELAASSVWDQFFFRISWFPFLVHCCYGCTATSVFSRRRILLWLIIFYWNWDKLKREHRGASEREDAQARAGKWARSWETAERQRATVYMRVYGNR